MGLQSIARAAFGQIKVIVPDAVVTVARKGQSCNGVADTTTSGESFSSAGENGITAGIVRVSVGDFDLPEKGEQIKVGNTLVECGDCRVDSSGAIITIPYTVIRPVEGL